MPAGGAEAETLSSLWTGRGGLQAGVGAEAALGPHTLAFPGSPAPCAGSAGGGVSELADTSGWGVNTNP